MKTIRAGLIGYGFGGRVFHARVIGEASGVELVTVVSSRPEAVRRDLPGVRVVGDVDALLKDPAVDLVVVATPNTTHRDLAERALRAGKHTVVDKPLVVRSSAGPELAALAQDAGLVLAAYQNRRWDGDFRVVEGLMREGRLGEVVLFESHFDRYRPAIKRGWREEPLEGSGLLFDLGSHLIDQALALFGEPDTVWADVTTQRDAGVVDDWFHVVLGWGSRRAILHAGTLVPDPGPRFQVHGTRGSFTTWGLDPQEERLIRGEAPDDGAGTARRTGRLVDGSGDRPRVREIPIPTGRYAAFYEAVAAAVRGEAENPVPAEAATRTIRVIEAAIRSSEAGCRLPLV